MKTILVIGASGDVGFGIAGALLDSGHRVIAAGRSADKLDTLKKTLAGRGRLETLAGSVASDAEAHKLAAAARSQAGTLGAVITSVNPPKFQKRTLELGADELVEALRGNVGAHFAALKAFLPAIEPGGLYMGIGGGMADLIFPGNGAASMSQAALRNLFRMVGKEEKASPVLIRELMIYSMVSGESNRAKADPSWMTDAEIGRHVAAIVAEPARFTGPVLTLKSKEQVGKPE